MTKPARDRHPLSPAAAWLLGLLTELDGLYRAHCAIPKRRPSTAISLEAAEWLISYALPAWQPRVIWDLGSGFSSWVFRLWQRDRRLRGAAEIPCVISTDTSAEWLEQCRAELEERQLATEHLWTHEAFLAELRAGTLTLPAADFVFLDLYKATGRFERLRELEPWIARECMLVIDDWHMPHVRAAAQAIGPRLGFGRVVDLKDKTLDTWGRFMAYSLRDAGRG